MGLDFTLGLGLGFGPLSRRAEAARLHHRLTGCPRLSIDKVLERWRRRPITRGSLVRDCRGNRWRVLRVVECGPAGTTYLEALQPGENGEEFFLEVVGPEDRCFRTIRLPRKRRAQ